jgi:monovalent cation/hydrogen antiporter
MEDPRALAFVLALACLIAAASVAAKRLRIAAPIVLLVAGIAVGCPACRACRSIPT